MEGHWQKYQDPESESDPNSDPLVRVPDLDPQLPKCHGSATLRITENFVFVKRLRYIFILGKVAYTDQKEEVEATATQAEQEGEEKSSGGGGLGYLTSAFSRIGFTSAAAAATPSEEKPEEQTEQEAETEDFFTSAFSKV